MNLHSLNRKWKASWIWEESLKGVSGTNRMLLFRRRFHLEEAAQPTVIHVSAETRYALYVNGKRVGIGPCKGDRFTRYYETFDISEYLHQGENVIAAAVLQLAPAGNGEGMVGGPSSVWRSNLGGFIFDAERINPDGNSEWAFGTDASWRCLHDESYALAWESWLSGNWMGGVERVDGRLRPQGWQMPDYDDSYWSQAGVIGGTINVYGVLNDWPLTPRTIPHMFETERRFVRIVRSCGGAEDTAGWVLSGEEASGVACSGTLLLAPNGSYWFEVDAGELSTGYVSIAVSGGEGSVIDIRCAECYETETIDGRRAKDVRDHVDDGYKLVGDADRYVVAGSAIAEYGQEETYEPFWFKTFRFVRLEIETGDKPLLLHRLDYRETGYPLDVKASFRCSDPSYVPLWDISVRTLRRCMHETYEDCPYYEQLQYAMDTALQMQFTYLISGDDRLARRAIHDFHSSRLPDGMLQSRYPAVYPQVIPGFSLYWIGMLHDHYMYFADSELIRTYLPTAEGVLNWFRRLLTPDCLIGRTSEEYWSYIDWVEGWKGGAPLAGQEGPMTVYSLLFAAAASQFADLCDALSRRDTANEYRKLASDVNEAVRINCWSEARGLFRDGPAVEQYSQHVQLWSVLSGAVTSGEAAALMHRTMELPDLAQVSYSMSYFLFRALSKAGVYDLVFSEWEPWHRMVEQNLTTWAETPTGNRSDCHAWGAVPLYDFTSEILGVKPELPGFERTVIQPRLGHLTFAEGDFVTSRGIVHVHWEAGDGRFRIEVDAPVGMELRLALPDGTEQLVKEGGRVHVQCSL